MSSKKFIIFYCTSNINRHNLNRDGDYAIFNIERYYLLHFYFLIIKVTRFELNWDKLLAKYLFDLKIEQF